MVQCGTVMVSHGNTFDILYTLLLEMITIPMELDIYTLFQEYHGINMSKETDNAILVTFCLMGA